MERVVLTLLWNRMSWMMTGMSGWKFFTAITRMMLAASSASGDRQFLLATTRHASASLSLREIIHLISATHNVPFS